MVPGVSTSLDMSRGVLFQDDRTVSAGLIDLKFLDEGFLGPEDCAMTGIETDRNGRGPGRSTWMLSSALSMEELVAKTDGLTGVEGDNCERSFDRRGGRLGIATLAGESQ